MSKKITGILTAIVTTFDAEGNYDSGLMKKQIQRQLRYDNAIFCNGTNGEFFVLNTKEKLAVTATCVEEVNGRVPVVSHIGEVSTQATIALGKEVARMGVDAVSVITPYFIPLKQEELIYHYTRIADEVPVPVYLYNIPARTGNTLQPETVKTLCQHPNIVGIKDSAGSYESLKGFLDASESGKLFDVLNGPDSLIHQGFVEGCAGSISGLANAAPEAVSHIWKHFRAGNIAGSKAAQDSVGGLRKDLYAVAFSPAAVKKAVALMGYAVGESRYPILFSGQDIQTIKDIIIKYSLKD